MTFADMDKAARQFRQQVLKQFAGNSSMARVRALIGD